MNKKVVIRNGKIVSGEAITIQPNETAANENRRNMRDNWRKEMLQKNQIDFYKAYPNHAKNLSDETRRLLS